MSDTTVPNGTPDEPEPIGETYKDDLHRIAQAAERIADALERAHPKPREYAGPGPLPMVATVSREEQDRKFWNAPPPDIF